MPNEKDLKEFLAETPLPDEEGDYTWWDADRDVAWDVEESYFGKLGAVFEAAGWERDYHRNGNRWHINVKVYGDYMKRRELRAKLAEELDLTDDEVSQYLERAWDWEQESFWDSLVDFDYVLSEERIDTGLTRDDYWQSGRMGGWLSVSDRYATYHPEEMILLAMYCRESVAYYNDSDGWHTYLREIIGDWVHDDREAEEARRKETPSEILKDILANGQQVRLMLRNDGMILAETSNGGQFRFEDDVAEFGVGAEPFQAIKAMGKAFYS